MKLFEGGILDIAYYEPIISKLYFINNLFSGVMDSKGILGLKMSTVYVQTTPAKLESKKLDFRSSCTQLLW